MKEMLQKYLIVPPSQLDKLGDFEEKIAIKCDMRVKKSVCV